MYQSLTWLQSILWTGVCAWLLLAISWLSAGYWLAIGWLCLKFNTPEDTRVVIYYYVLKWHMAAINTLDYTVFTRCFGYQLLFAAYWLAIAWLFTGYQHEMALNQYTSRHSHVLLCTKIAHGCNQYFGLECVHNIFWLSAGCRLAIVWLLVGYVPKSIHFKT